MTRRIRTDSLSQLDLRIAAALWLAGMGSLEIAQRLGLRESIIWANLTQIRTYARQNIVAKVQEAAE